MKLPTLVDAAIALAVLAVFITPAQAKGSSHPKGAEQTSSVVDAIAMPRAITWNDSRIWQRTDGTILVCPWEVEVPSYNGKRVCETEARKIVIDRWIALQDYKIEGMVLKGYEYRFIGSGGSTVMITYFGPPIVAGLKTETTVSSPTITGPLTIKADKITVTTPKVYIHRKK